MSTVDLAVVEAQLKFRYAVKKFDATRIIPAATWKLLEQSLVLSPSSFGLQPWKFVVVANPELRKQLVPASWGQAQVADASHLVVLCAKDTLTTGDADRFLKAASEARGVPLASLAGYGDMMKGFINNPPPGFDAKAWSTKQVYIALGQFMTTAAMLGVDTCPMEGFVPADYARILNLGHDGFSPVVVCPAGYRSPEDRYASTPKVRYPTETLVKYL